ncbi:MAG: hypothetical protein ACR2PQ_11045 [Myxococcota bacterium]
MEERIQRSATHFTESTSGTPAGASAPGRRFESPTIVEISLCCEISAYAPDGDDQPLF